MLGRPLPPGRRTPRTAIVKCESNGEAALAPSQVNGAAGVGVKDVNYNDGETLEAVVMEVVDRPPSTKAVSYSEETPIHQEEPNATTTIDVAYSGSEEHDPVQVVAVVEVVDTTEPSVEQVIHEPSIEHAVIHAAPIEAVDNVEEPMVQPHAHSEASQGHADASTKQHVPSAAVPPRIEWYGLDQVTQPWTAVPELPSVDSLACVYDDDARALQKQILRAVKWCTGGDKAKVEEFKISSRLFGNGFMDCDEYTASMATELGPLHMLVIVPVMLRLQPDLVKKQLLYVALISYRTKHLAKLQALVDGSQ
ncbi:hypothetical protein DYB28_008095 [Aphanomyces astaci]|uniref:ZNF598/HEL2 PAH domain-containing protein n=1 Tax=Aphanomyces astaci TaxID=112090 RepID=A0A9X8DK05_APHAT|nr:hypothetical protein DYB28_008095 [Aphanomyces astaci]